MTKVLHSLATHWDVLVGIVTIIVFVVRTEVAVRVLRRDFDRCQAEHGTAAEQRPCNRIENSHDALQAKIETLIERTSELVGKISLIERRMNGGGK